MKTFKHAHKAPCGGWATTMNLLTISALFLGSCNTNDPIATPVLNADYSIIDGDTIKTVIFKDYKKLNALDPNGKNYIVVGDTVVTYREPKLHTPPAKAPDLSKLKNNDDPDLKGKPLRYVAIGGSLTAGVRDGGYFNEGILTSYPNLIARQMKLQKFEQPLFDAADYNGFGRKVRTTFNPTGGPVQKLVNVKNNEAIESYSEVEVGSGNTKGKVLDVKLKKYINFKGVDNWGIPFLTSWQFGQRPTIFETWDVNKAVWQSYSFHKRLLSDSPNNYYDDRDPNNNLYSKFIGNKFDFVTIEFGIDDYLQGLYGVADGMQNFWKIFTLIKERKIRGAIANIPSPYYCPFFYQVSLNDLKKGLMTNTVYYEGTNNGLSFRPMVLSNPYLPKPNGVMDSLASTKVNIAFKKGMNEYFPIPRGNVDESYFFDKEDVFGRMSREYGLALVDLNALYKQIFSGKYTTDEGVLVENKMNGNFFSADGISPTAFGQAIIANEFIKAINKQYATEIPLIKTSEYLEKR